MDRLSVLGLGVVLLLSGCAAPAPAPPAEPPTAATTPVPAAPTTASEPTAPAGLSFEPVTYRDESAGFEFDYPSGWTIGPIEQYSRGGVTALTSWSRPTDTLPGETPPGETRLDVTVQLWEPINDLAAFVETRMVAWAASDIRVITQEEWALADGRPAQGFVVEGSEGAQAYFLFTTLADKYLALSGDGNLGLLAEIARTVRPLPD